MVSQVHIKKPHRILSALVFAAFALNAHASEGGDDEGSETQSTESKFVAPVFKKSLNSTQPEETEDESRLEGWAQMSYVVGTDGKPRAIVVIATDGKKNHIESSKRFLENLRFTPASYNGKAVESAQVYMLVQDKGFVGGLNEGITPGFHSRYSDARRLIRQRICLSSWNPATVKI